MEMCWSMLHEIRTAEVVDEDERICGRG